MQLPGALNDPTRLPAQGGECQEDCGVIDPCYLNQACADSQFSTDAGCAAGPDASLSIFDAGGTCTGEDGICVQSECCTRPGAQLCTDSMFSASATSGGMESNEVYWDSVDGYVDGTGPFRTNLIADKYDAGHPMGYSSCQGKHRPSDTDWLNPGTFQKDNNYQVGLLA